MLLSRCKLLAGFLLTAAVASSQTVNGTLLGVITDSSGGAVPNAQVLLKETNTGLARESRTGDAGTYVFSNLPQGTYSVSVEVQGFKKGVREKVDVLVNTTVRVDLTLHPGSVTETVLVTAEAPRLQTDRSDTGIQIEEKRLANLPVSTRGGRNFQALLNFVPGATRVTFEHSEFFNAASTLQTRVNGQSRLANNLQFEGVDNNERTGLLQVLIPPIEALQTVDITTSNYEAELGRATGAVTNIVLKSGTNQLHGEGYWFNRVSALSSRGFYDPARGNFVYNYFGGQVSGPIIKNRTFFFYDFLRQTDHRYANDRYTIPIDAERTGNLSVSPSVIYDPATGNPDGSGRVPIADKQIPLSRIGAIQRRILALVPSPNQPGLNQNYFTQVPFVRNTNQFDVKGDHQHTDSDRFSVRYSRSVPTTYDGPAYGAAGGPHGGGFQGTGTQATHNGAINYNHIFSPTFLTEVRAGVSRYRNDARQVDYGTNASDALGVPGVNTGDPFVSGLVSIEIDNFSNPTVGYSASLPWVRAETNIDLVNTWTKTLSRHTVKWGADLRRIRDELLQAQTFNPRGVYRYGVNQTSIPGAPTSFGNSMASFLLDQPRQAGRDLPLTFPTFRAWQLFSFVQDKWQVTQKLTIDIGLRWEFYPPAVSSHARGGFSNYDPSNNTLVVTGYGGNPQNMGMRTNTKDFAPRFGVAYRLSEKTVLRAGYGLSFTPFPDNQYGWNNFPVTQNNSYNPAFTYGPAILSTGLPATLARGFPAPTPAVIPDNGIIVNAPDFVYNVINKEFREPYVQSWNLAVQRALPYNFSVDVAYVANHGVAQPANFNLNAAPVLGLDVQGQPLVRPFNRRSNTNLRYRGFSSSYNSMQVKIDKRFSGGMLVNGHYTWSKALGHTLRYYINPERNWSRLDFDRRQNFAIGYVYELPFGKGKRWMNANPVAAQVLGGWQINGSFGILTGAALNFGGNSGVLRAPGNENSLNYFGSQIPVLKGNGRDAPW
ncbi:MAG: TonB-dependent receptor domain-containing protein, partial [Bryobacteraceae bacterium]